MIEIFGGSASTKPLNFGCQTIDDDSAAVGIDDDEGDKDDNDDDDDDDDVPGPSSRNSLNLKNKSNCSLSNGSTSETSFESNQCSDYDDDGKAKEIESGASRKKKQRKNIEKNLPQLIYDKKRHLEKSLSSRQRDELLLKEAKEDWAFCKNLCDSIRESNQQFVEAMKSVSLSFVQVAECNAPNNARVQLQ